MLPARNLGQRSGWGSTFRRGLKRDGPPESKFSCRICDNELLLVPRLSWLCHGFPRETWLSCMIISACSSAILQVPCMFLLGQWISPSKVDHVTGGFPLFGGSKTCWCSGNEGNEPGDFFQGNHQLDSVGWFIWGSFHFSGPLHLSPLASSHGSWRHGETCPGPQGARPLTPFLVGRFGSLK